MSISRILPRCAWFGVLLTLQVLPVSAQWATPSGQRPTPGYLFPGSGSASQGGMGAGNPFSSGQPEPRSLERLAEQATNPKEKWMLWLAAAEAYRRSMLVADLTRVADKALAMPLDASIDPHGLYPALMRWKLAFADLYLGDYDQGLARLQQTESVFERAFRQAGISASGWLSLRLNNQALRYLAMLHAGNRSGAQEALLRLHEILEAEDGRLLRPQLVELVKLLQTNLQSAIAREAIALQQFLLNVSEKADGIHSESAMALRYQLGGLLLANGLNEEALHQYDQVLAHSKEPRYRFGRARALLQSGRWDEAESILRTMLNDPLLSRTNPSPAVFLALTLLEQGKPAEALSYLAPLVAATSTGPNTRQYRVWLSTLQRDAGDLEAAQMTLQAVLAEQRETAKTARPHTPGYVLNRYQEAELLMLRGQLSTARQQVGELLQTYSPEWQIALLRNQDQTHRQQPRLNPSHSLRELLNLYVGKDDEAELETAFALTQLSENDDLPDSQGLSALAQGAAPQWGGTLQQWKAKLLELQRLETQGEATAPSAQVQARIQLSQLEAELLRLEPRFALLQPSHRLKLTQLRQSLAPQEALVHYVVGRDSLLAWVITAQHASLHKLPATPAQLQPDLVLMQRAMRPVGGLVRPFPQAVSRRLHQALVEPLAPALSDSPNLHLVLPEILDGLSFAALLGPADAACQSPCLPWLARRHTLQRLASPRSLVAQRSLGDRPSRPSAFLGIGGPDLDGSPGSAREALLEPLAIGDPALAKALRALPRLPEANDELAALAQTWGGTASALLLGPAAREGHLRRLDLAAYPYMAFSTHALMPGELGLANQESALVLTPPPEGAEVVPDDDGLLTASEIARLPLQARLVVLAACNTGRQTAPGYRHWRGLLQAFQFAGARSVLASQWSVDSSATRQLMQTLAQTLRGDAAAQAPAPAAALRHSMLALADGQAGARWQHPYYWAPFFITAY